MPERTLSELAPPAPGGGRLAVTLAHTGPVGDSALVYVHGFGSTRAGRKALALEAACARRGWTLVRFDFRAHGDSPGEMLALRGRGLLEDLEAVRAALAGRGVRRLLPVGSSMGGFATAWYARQVGPGVVPACVLLAPAFHFLHRRFEQLPPWERDEFRRTGRLRVRNEWVDAEISHALVEEGPQFPFVRLAAEWAIPALVYHGVMDDVVPFADSVEFLRRAAHPRVELRLLKDGDHQLTAHKDTIAEEACRFFAEWV
jgi:pimeloyl-ACP methyl ester carboxylesterase